MPQFNKVPGHITLQVSQGVYVELRGRLQAAEMAQRILDPGTPQERLDLTGIALVTVGDVAMGTIPQPRQSPNRCNSCGAEWDRGHILCNIGCPYCGYHA